MNIEESKKFYKYRSMRNVDNISDLCAKTIRFSHTEDFNDPFDCFGRLITSCPEEYDINDETYKTLVNKLHEENGAIKIEITKEEFIKFMKDMLNKLPIYCLSQVNDNPLMWSHYADGLRGFCIEFKDTANFLSGIKPVQYDNSLPEVKDVYELMLRAAMRMQEVGDDEQYLDLTYQYGQKLFCTKLKRWDYEKEWRIVNVQKNFNEHPSKTKFYDEKDISSIIIGERMKEEHRKLIKSIVSGTYGGNVKLQIAKIKKNGEIKIDQYENK